MLSKRPFENLWDKHKPPSRRADRETISARELIVELADKARGDEPVLVLIGNKHHLVKGVSFDGKYVYIVAAS